MTLDVSATSTSANQTRANMEEAAKTVLTSSFVIAYQVRIIILVYNTLYSYLFIIRIWRKAMRK